MIKNSIPLDAQLLLQRAAKTPITPSDPLARVKAIEAATVRIRRDYPHLFKEERPYAEDDDCGQ